MTSPLPVTAAAHLLTIGDPLLEGSGTDAPSLPNDFLTRFCTKVHDTDLFRTVMGGKYNDTIDAVAKKTFDHELVDPMPIGDAVTPAPDPHPTALRRLELDEDRLVRAPDVFSLYGNEIAGALLLAALPEAYAARYGSEVLFATHGLTTGLDRRVKGTAQFLTIVTQRPPSAKAAQQLWNPHAFEKEGRWHFPYPPPWRMCTALRLYHAGIRATFAKEDLPKVYADKSWAVINQQELLATLLSFTITVFEVLEQFGITWTAADQDAYLHLWDVVGAYLGVGSMDVQSKLGEAEPPFAPTWPGLRPPTVEDSRALLAELRRQQWIVQSPKHADPPGTRPGRLLVRALLDRMVSAMPTRTQSLPLEVMRQLAPPIVGERLALGVPRVVMGTLGVLPGRRVMIDRFTEAEKPNLLNARVTRTMANEVTRRTLIQFVNEGFVIPGLEQWTDGFVETRA